MSHPVPARPITAGPRYHWFGYYDKFQFDAEGRRVLGMAVDFEHRSPRPGDVIEIGLVDLADGDRWVRLGDSRAWGWQQGCMLQWRPGVDNEVIWNDRDRFGGKDQFVSRILNVETNEERALPLPIYTISPDGRIAVTPDFRRINDMRPGYGYAGLPDPYADQLAPQEGGIHRLDLDTGEHEQIISLAQIAAMPYPHGDISAAKHYFNHLLFNPAGSRFIFLHRWRFGEGTFHTRMCTAAADGSDVRVVDDSGHTSHFIWRDPEHILAWSYHPSRGTKFYLYRDEADVSGEPEAVAPRVMRVNGHCTYLSGAEWILNDTYPGAARLQELYLYHVPNARKVLLGHFHAPPEYEGEWRCDLHPRTSRDGRQVCIDSAHAGQGRQMYLLDIGPLIAA